MPCPAVFIRLWKPLLFLTAGMTMTLAPALADGALEEPEVVLSALAAGRRQDQARLLVHGDLAP